MSLQLILTNIALVRILVAGQYKLKLDGLADFSYVFFYPYLRVRCWNPGAVHHPPALASATGQQPVVEHGGGLHRLLHRRNVGAEGVVTVELAGGNLPSVPTISVLTPDDKYTWQDSLLGLVRRCIAPIACIYCEGAWDKDSKSASPVNPIRTGLF